MITWLVAFNSKNVDNRAKNTVTLPNINSPVLIIMLKIKNDVGSKYSIHSGSHQRFITPYKPRDV